MDTARRMAKMYINEIMSGRYDPMPNPSAFPNYIENGYEGMLVVRSELTSLCSTIKLLKVWRILVSSLVLNY